MTPVKLTDDHSPFLRNGIADWLYERTTSFTLVIVINITYHSLL